MMLNDKRKEMQTRKQNPTMGRRTRNPANVFFFLMKLQLGLVQTAKLDIVKDLVHMLIVKS